MMTDFCEHVNEFSGFLKSRNFLGIFVTFINYSRKILLYRIGLFSAVFRTDYWNYILDRLLTASFTSSVSNSSDIFLISVVFNLFFPRTPRDTFPLNFVPPKLLVHNSSYT
jgi:hypothetical protein